jgi:malonate transporter MadL subunit
MIMYGLGILAFSFFAGQFFGEYLGELLGVQANVGGVGFAMLFLIFIKDFLEKRKWTSKDFDLGIDFWNKLYVPVVIAMSATQNVKVAVSSGMLALAVGLIPLILLFGFFPLIVKTFSSK